MSHSSGLSGPMFLDCFYPEYDVAEHKMCVSIFCTTFTCKIFILKRIQRNIVINIKTSYCKVPVILVKF
jgi:hypothetical protein